MCSAEGIMLWAFMLWWPAGPHLQCILPHGRMSGTKKPPPRRWVRHLRLASRLAAAHARSATAPRMQCSAGWARRLRPAVLMQLSQHGQEMRQDEGNN